MTRSHRAESEPTIFQVTVDTRCRQQALAEHRKQLALKVTSVRPRKRMRRRPVEQLGNDDRLGQNSRIVSLAVRLGREVYKLQEYNHGSSSCVHVR